jgi:hypothetical protein
MRVKSSFTQGGPVKKISAIACAVLFSTAVMAGQSRPDFSGTWAHDPQQSGNTGRSATAPAASAAGKPAAPPRGATARLSGGGGGSVELRIAQTASGLTIERLLGPTTRKFVHTFDGKENLNVNGRSTLRTESRWNGGQLITEGTEVTALDTGDVTSTVLEVRSVGAGGELIVETAWTTEGRTTTARQVYTKKKKA